MFHGTNFDKRRSYSAGIIPYTIRENEIYYLLGRDWRDEGWSDFGGKVEDIDNYNIINTAIREFYEETMGAVLTQEELNYKMKNNSLKSIKSVTLNGSPYYMYFIYIDDCDYKKQFEKIHNFLVYSKISEEKFMEKCDITWISSKNMMKSIPDMKLRNIFKRTLTRCRDVIQDIEKEILKDYALKE